MSERKRENTDGETESARILQLQAMLQGNPSDVFLNYALGLEKASSGDNFGALACFQQTLAINEQYLAAYYHGAKAASAIGEVETSKQLIDKGLEVALVQKDMKTHQELLFLQEDYGFDED